MEITPSDQPLLDFHFSNRYRSGSATQSMFYQIEKCICEPDDAVFNVRRYASAVASYSLSRPDPSISQYQTTGHPNMCTFRKISCNTNANN